MELRPLVPKPMIPKRETQRRSDFLREREKERKIERKKKKTKKKTKKELCSVGPENRM